MIALPQDRMDQLLKRFSMIESQMANNPDSETYVKLASEYSELQEVVGKIRELTDARREAVDLAAMRDDAATDAEMRALALVDSLSMPLSPHASAPWAQDCRTVSRMVPRDPK